MLVWLASNSHAEAMMSHGIAVYRYTSGFLHEKVVLVDDKIAAVGTTNFDNRSFNINFEVTLWFTDPGMIGDVEAMLERDFAAARRATEADVRHKNWALRFIGHGARLLSPIL
jgi:cardiolipin synthase